MRVRLHHYIHEFGLHALNMFDVDFWKRATGLASFGVELRVHRGFAEVELRHFLPGQAPVTLHRLSQASAGSVFSPPYFPPQMGGTILPVVVAQSEDADFTLYFGTNDPPPEGWPRIALLTDPAGAAALTPAFERFRHEFGPEERLALRMVVMAPPESGAERGLNPDLPVWQVPLSQKAGSGFAQAIASFGFGDLAGCGITHLGLLEAGRVPHPEILFRLIALIRHLKPGFYAAAAVHAAPDWQAGGQRMLGLGLGAMAEPAWPHDPCGAGLATEDVAALAAAVAQPPELPLPGLICLPLGAVRATGLPDGSLHHLEVTEYLSRIAQRPAVCAAISVPSGTETGAEIAPAEPLLEALWRERVQILALRGHLADLKALKHRQEAVQARAGAGREAEALARVVTELGRRGTVTGWNVAPGAEGGSGGGLRSWLGLSGTEPDLSATIAALVAQNRQAAHPFAASAAKPEDALWHIFTQLHQRVDALRHEMQGMAAAAEQQTGRRLFDIGIADPARTKADLARPNILAVSALYKRHKGQRAVIIGNGPSLRIPDLARLDGDVCFGSNKIFLSFDQTDWRPTYYTVEDHLVLAGTQAEVSRMRGVQKVFPDNMRHHGFHDPDVVFVPRLPPKSWEDPLSDPDFPQFSLDLVQGLHWGSTVVYAQIQMAVFMGCREIYLIGVDHSYRLPAVKEGNT
ncbi:MAG: hypothetical protein JNN06_12045, partial [Gemmobacter sp.]